MMQGWYYEESLTGHDRVQTESQELQPWTAVCCFDLVGSRQHGVAYNEIIGWSTDFFCLCAVSLSLQRHDILDFSCCPLARVLHVTLANLQKCGSEFHLRSSPCAYSGWSVVQPNTSLLATPCWRDRKERRRRNNCPRLQFLAFSLDSTMPLPR